MKDKAIKDAMNSIKNRISHVYNQGYEDGLKDGKESVQIDETEAYKLGYENGLTCKEYIQIDESTAYRAGLETAWELARKLSNLGFNEKRKEIFGEKYGLSIDIIKNFSVDEVADKIKEYEEKQKRPCDTCKYSGHTLQDLRKCVYCDGSCCWTPKKMTLDEASKMAKAALECMKREVSGCDEMCNSHKCDECALNYEKGNMGEQKEWLCLVIKALEQQPILDKLRAEIMQLDYDTESIDYDHNDMPQTETVHTICREEVLQIIDKYKAENEQRRIKNNDNNI